MTDIPSIIAKHLDACVAELREHVTTEFRAALGGGIVAPPAETPRSRPAAPRKPKRIAAPASKPTKALPAPKQRGARTCGCGPVGRHRRTCKLKAAERTSSSDDEDSGAAGDPVPPRDDRPDRDAPDLVVAERAVRRARAIDAAEELPVIRHARLVAMLAADRANNAVGDAGGVMLREDRGPSLVGRAETKREHCPVHGWVGRVMFERDGHEHCRAERPGGATDCPDCEGTGWPLQTAHSTMCNRCDGHGFIVEAVALPVDNNEKVKAETYDYIVDESGERYRTRDHRGHDRAETTSLKKLTRAELAAGWEEIAQMDRVAPGFVEPTRPQTRADCIDGPRPCPWVSCRYHLAIDVNPETGSLKMVFPDVDPWALPHSCALDAAALGPHTLEALAEKLNITRERVRQLEVKTLYAAAAAAARRRIRRDVLEDTPHDAAEGAGT